MKENLLANIRIVLVEPAGALNLGSIARVMKNMGLTNLVLVNPKCDRHDESARIMAVHAADVLENAVVVDSLPEALSGCQRAIATTVRSRSVPIDLEQPTAALPWLLSPNIQTALMFGAEDRGLSNDELKYAQRFVCVRSNPDYPSLNLAQAVAICAYEIYQASLKTDDDPAPIVSPLEIIQDNLNNAPIDVLEGYYQHLEDVLLEIGYLQPHTAPVKMEKFRRLFNKANLQPEEVAMLRGILRQVGWAVNNKP